MSEQRGDPHEACSPQAVCGQYGDVPCLGDLQARLAAAEAALKEAQDEIERERGRCKNTALAWAHACEMQDAVVKLRSERDEAQQAQARGKAALEVLEWLPEDQGDWAECPCCGARKFDGHIADGCQLEAALTGTGWPDVVVQARWTLVHDEAAFAWLNEWADNNDFPELAKYLRLRRGNIRTILRELGAGE